MDACSRKNKTGANRINIQLMLLLFCFVFDDDQNMTTNHNLAMRVLNLRLKWHMSIHYAVGTTLVINEGFSFLHAFFIFNYKKNA